MLIVKSVRKLKQSAYSKRARNFAKKLKDKMISFLRTMLHSRMPKPLCKSN